MAKVADRKESSCQTEPEDCAKATKIDQKELENQ